MPTRRQVKVHKPPTDIVGDVRDASWPTSMLIPIASESSPLDLSSVRRAATVADLTAIFETSANVVLHPRRLASGVQAEAERAASQRNFRLIASIAMSPSGAFEPPLALVELPALAADVLYWVEAFAELTGANLVGVRMARLEAPMCPRFHTDRVTLRLVATYLGPGTECLPSKTSIAAG